jgi:hypothetical protein
MAVSDSERKIDKLKKDNEELRARLHDLQIDTTSNTASSGDAGTDEEIIDLSHNL